VNTRKQAIELASAHLRDQGSALVFRQKGLRRNERLGLWRVGYCDPNIPTSCCAAATSPCGMTAGSSPSAPLPPNAT
jgi:hypothetical protein